MTSRCDRALPPAGALSAGFTLIEMLVVVAILGMSLVLVSGFRAPWSKGLEIDGTAAELAAQLRFVRSAAIAENHPALFAFDVAARRYQAGAAPPRTLPPALGLKLLSIAGEQQNSDVGGIRFNPDGTSTGGRIVLDNGVRRVAVGVEWLTGKVSVADIR